MLRTSEIHEQADPFGPDEVQCPIREMLARTGARWTLDVFIVLRNGRAYFGEMARTIPGVSRRMLVLTLRGMERDGLITRSGEASTGDRVYYELTILGMQLGEHFRALGEWSQRNRDTIYAARERYDRSSS